MLDQSVSTPARVRSVDIRRFPWIKRIAADYASGAEGVREFFAGHPSDPEAWRVAIARVQAHPRRRDTVADILEAQQRRRGAPQAAIDSAARLRDPRTVAVVTGQQAGLFGGPLFTLLKALTAIRQAEEVRTRFGVPAVAVFWVDSEDHDWDEIRTCTVLDAEDTPQVVTLDRPEASPPGPISRVVLDPGVDAAVGALQAALPPTEFTADLVARLRQAYRPGIGMADAFARWLESLAGARGLVVYDASDPAAKPLVADLFGREVDRAGDACRLAAETGAALEARGYHAQVSPVAGSLALFHLGTEREPIRTSGDGFLIGDRVEAATTLASRVRTAPQEFSPGVLLRPLVQDVIFPTACYVAGPSELAYLAQLGRVYAAFDVPMPLVLQRATATLLDSNASRFLAKHDLAFEALAARDDSALNALLAAQLPASVEAAIADAERAIDTRMQEVAAAMPLVDPTLQATARTTHSRMRDDLRKLQAKVVQAAKRKDETLRRQFTHAQAQAFPLGHPQERQLGVIGLLNKYGPSLVDRLHDELTLEMGQHAVLGL